MRERRRNELNKEAKKMFPEVEMKQKRSVEEIKVLCKALRLAYITRNMILEGLLSKDEIMRRI